MAGNKYYDATAAIQVIGCVLNNPHLLDEDGTYSFSENDFSNDFHRVILEVCITYTIWVLTNLNTKTLEDYLQNKPNSLAIYNANKGQNGFIKLLR